MCIKNNKDVIDTELSFYKELYFVFSRDLVQKQY